MSTVRCSECGTVAPAGARFCAECGTALGGHSPPAPAGRKREPGEERRRATVLFADLSGYTAIAERLDPEDTKALVDRVLGRLSREATDRGGRIDKYIGDNVMAVFGAPLAHEDDPERAVMAGLAMQEAMSEINAEVGARAASRDVELALRVGINSGEVLAGRMGDQYTVIGDTVNVAARLQAASRLGAVTVGAATRRLTAAAIEYRELEPLTLKGKSRPIAAWEAVGAVDQAARLQPGRGATALIGRDEELALLASLFDRAVRESRPYLVTVLGEAGVGKSRLVNELAAELTRRAEPVDVLVGRSPAYGTTTAYAALVEVLSDERLEASAAASQLARLLGVDGRTRPSDGPGDDDPEQIRDRIFAAARRLLEQVSTGAPVVLALEDVHWADEGMLDLIEHLAAGGRGPVLIVCLARDELLARRPTWGGGKRDATTISLDPLSPGAAEDLVRSLLAGGRGGAELAAKVATRSGGNPLFAEEMVNRLRDEDSDDVERLPDSVHAVLAARLDALGADERRLLQVASVVGQHFWEAIVGELSDEQRAGELLPGLVDKDLITPSSTSRLAGEREFAFKHALVRDVAYETLPRAVRSRRHFELAGIIEGRATATLTGVAGLLAEHYGRAAALAEEADFPAEELLRMRVAAAHASESAGDVAAALYSNAEALAHYGNALGLPAGLEPGERARIEASRGDTAFRSGHVDAAVEDWARALGYEEGDDNRPRAGELHRKIGSGLWHKADREASIAHFQQGIDLLRDGGPSRELIELYGEAASVYVETGDNMLAIYAAEKAQRLADELGQPATASRAHLTFGRVFGRIGDLEQARGSFERAVELAREASPGETVRALLALGRHLDVAEADYPAAQDACEEALELAAQVGDVPSQVELHAALGQLAVHPGRWADVARHADVSARLAESEGLSGQLCLPLLLDGISAWRHGDWGSAEAHLQRSHSIAVAGGRSEAAFSALLWLGASKRDRDDYQGAKEALLGAAEVSDRAGLSPQSVEATCARAALSAFHGREDDARLACAAAERLLQHGDHPVSLAAIAEARAAAADDAGLMAPKLREAVGLWEGVGRPLNAIRARLLLSRALRAGDPVAADEELRTALAAAERLDVAHLAAAARDELVPG